MDRKKKERSKKAVVLIFNYPTVKRNWIKIKLGFFTVT